MIEVRNEDAVAALATATNWRKASYSQGATGCVEVASALVIAANWRKSSYSQGDSGCVEVGSVPTVVGVRDTKLGPRSPILAFSPPNWSAFIARANETNR
jgi:hypothetical protein